MQNLSGAGKSTLLNALAGQNQSSVITSGGIYINQQLVRDRSLMTKVCAYVQQNDLFYGTFTVREHLIFQVL